MAVFELMEKYGHEQVVFNYDPVSGLRAIVAIHDTTLGPALGGARMWPYRTEEEALIDVLRLSRGMTYKSAVMGLNLGGGKAVIIGDPRKDKSEELFRAFGKFIETLNGRYITAEDVGTNPDDMDIIRTQTRWVAGLRETSGNPSPATAFGVFRAMQAAVRYLWNLDSLKGLKVAVQGTGSVGVDLVRQLVEAGATVVATDIYRDRLDEAVKLGARACSPDEIYSQECDIFAPCALGGVLNDDTIPRLKAKIICGCANNQLLEPYHAGVLAERGILYCPDFVVNGGGVTNVADEFKPGGYNRERAMASVSKIYDILLRVLERSREKGIDTCRAAEELAEERIALALKQKKMYVAD